MDTYTEMFKIKTELKSIGLKCLAKGKGVSASTLKPVDNDLPAVSVALPKTMHALGVFGIFGTTGFVSSYLYLKAHSHWLT